MNLLRRLKLFLAKSLYDVHPELRDREHVWRIWSDEASEKPLSFREHAEDYSITTWVHVALRKWQDAVSSLGLHVVDRAGKRIDHDLDDFLESPNPEMSSADLYRQWATDLGLGGEVFFELAWSQNGKRPLELWPHQPSVVTVLPDVGRKMYYVPRGYEIECDPGKKYVLSARELVRWKFYNPVNPWRGISPMSAARMSVSVEQLASAWAKMFFLNGARPDGVLLTPQGITPSERERMEERMREMVGFTRTRGANWHKVLVLEEGITDYKPINFTQRDMQWAESRRLSRNEIGGIFGVPDELMGFGKDTYENFERALLTFWSETVLPLLRFRDEGLTRFFRTVGVLGKSFRIVSDLSKIEVLARLRQPTFALAVQMAGMGVPFRIINEYLQLGVPDYPAAGLSNPFGSSESFDESGAPVEGEADPDVELDPDGAADRGEPTEVSD